MAETRVAELMTTFAKERIMGYMTPGRNGTMYESREEGYEAERQPMRGLGDLLAWGFKKIGIEVAVKKISKGKDCGCKKRQELLNKAVPFGGSDELQPKQD